jgi:hypothetical protein
LFAGKTSDAEMPMRENAESRRRGFLKEEGVRTGPDP